MAAPAYSRRFLTRKGLSSNSQVIQVPAGRVYVVRAVTMYVNAFVGGVVALKDWTHDSILILHTWGPADRRSEFDDVRLVFEPGEGFLIAAGGLGAGDSADVSISGYDLSLV